MRLSRHHREVEGLIPLDYPILILKSVATHAAPRRMSQYDDATMVLHVKRSSDCCLMSNLSVSFAFSYTSCRKAIIEGPMAPEADKAIGVKMV